ATDARVTRIVFCAGDRGVETNQGVIGVPSVVVGDGKEGMGGAWMVDRWAVNGGWIEFAGRRVLEVRGEVRPRCSAVFEGCMALGHEAGRVSILVFEEGLVAGGVAGL